MYNFSSIWSSKTIGGALNRSLDVLVLLIEGPSNFCNDLQNRKCLPKRNNIQEILVPNALAGVANESENSKIPNITTTSEFLFLNDD